MHHYNQKESAHEDSDYHHGGDSSGDQLSRSSRAGSGHKAHQQKVQQDFDDDDEDYNNVDEGKAVDRHQYRLIPITNDPLDLFFQATTGPSGIRLPR